MKTAKPKKETIGLDLRDFISETIVVTAENHLEAWKERYRKYKKVSNVKFDLDVNHDDSLEVEYAEETLNRELNGKEYVYFIGAFHREVVKQYKEYINC